MKQMDKDEYKALREEMQMRVQLMNTHNVGMIMAVIAMWSVGGLLIQGAWEYTEKILTGELQNAHVFIGIIIWGIASLFMFFPILIQVPLAVKSGDNLGQIATIAGYMKVFAEVPSILYNATKEESFKAESMGIIGWECFQKKEVAFPLRARFFNSEYIILTCISMMLYLITAFAGCFNFWSSMALLGKIVLILFFSALLVLAVLALVLIVKCSSSKNLLKNIKDRENYYLEIAEKLNTYLKDNQPLLEFDRERYRDILNIR